VSVNKQAVEAEISAIGGEETLSRAQIRGRIFSLAGPAIAESLLVHLVSMVDMMMVGGLGAYAITSIGLSNQAVFTANAVFSAISTGSTAVVARLVGAKDLTEANRAARQSFVMAAIAAMILGLGVVLFAPNIIHFMKAEEDVLPHALAYARIAGGSMVFSLTAMILNGVLRGAGDMKTPMRVNITANLINVVFNYLLIYGVGPFPRLEVAGAAWATLLSRVVALIMVLRVFFGGKFIIHFSLRDSFKPEWPMLKRILNVGIPASIEHLIMRMGMMLYARTVSGLGTVAYAAHQISLNAEGITFTPGMGFSMASTTLVGQSLGAKRPERASQFGLEARRLAMISMGLLGLVLFFFPRQLIGLYTDDPEVIEMGVICLRIIAFAQPIMGSTFVLTGSLRGAGDTRFVMLITLFGVWVGRLGMAYLLVEVFQLGLRGAWYAMVFDQAIRATFGYLRWRHGGWKTARV
jgi:putative MATE family efflux protein